MVLFLMFYYIGKLGDLISYLDVFYDLLSEVLGQDRYQGFSKFKEIVKGRVCFGEVRFVLRIQISWESVS